MMLRNLQIAGASAAPHSGRKLPAMSRPSRRPGLAASWKVRGAQRTAQQDAPRDKSALLYGAAALGLMAGAAISTYLWKQRARALNLLHATPFERAEELISSCEHKIADIERAIEELKTAAR